MSELALRHGLSFAELYQRDGLVRLDRAFVGHLAAVDAALHQRLMAGRAALDRKAESDLLVDLAPHLEDFLGELFGVAAEVRALQARSEEHTSELQSQFHLVCRLLLEKKKKQ